MKSPSCAALPTSLKFPRMTSGDHSFESPGSSAVLRGFAISCATSLLFDKCHWLLGSSSAQTFNRHGPACSYRTVNLLWPNRRRLSLFLLIKLYFVVIAVHEPRVSPVT